MQLHLFDTVGLPKSELKEHNDRAIRQEWLIHEILENVGTHLTPYEVHRLFVRKHGRVAKVSIGRALTRGTKAGIFEKVPITKKGDWGINNNQWRAIKIEDKSKVKFK